VLFTAIALRNYARLDECAPYVIEDGSDTPAELDAAKRAEIDETIRQACAALGWDTCGLTVKGDLVLHQGRIYIIELAARLSGGYFASDIIPAAYGVDMVGAAIRLALGQPVDAPKPCHSLSREAMWVAG
jgi:biotin carboxylase